MHKLYQVTWLMLVLLMVSVPAKAQTSALDANFDHAQRVGEARLKYMLWSVFDASLYSDNGNYDEDSPFALELTYLRKLKGGKIVDKTMQEIDRLSNGSVAADRLNAWRQKLTDIIPDVSAGMSITAVRSRNGHTLLYVGDDKKGVFEDTDFTKVFFSIWLGEKTNEPRLRRQLIGLDRTS